MPRRYELTWTPHARKWRKRYRGTQWYFPSDRACGGKKDIESYRAAFAEWERVKAWQDGLAACPYVEGHTGRGRVLIPEERMPEDFGFASRPVATTQALAPAASAVATMELPSNEPTPLSQPGNLPPHIIGVGFAPMLTHPEPHGSTSTEVRISALITEYLDRREKEVEAGELSLAMWGEDKRNLNIFLDFLIGHYADCTRIDQITPAVLSQYRAHAQAETASGRTLKKRLATVAKWMNWLADENFLSELPKDLSRYAKVKSLGGSPKQFFTVEQVKRLYESADEPLRLWLLLGLNAGLTQREIATLEADHVDWENGILERPRNKTGELTRAKLWPKTMRLLKEQRTDDGSPLLRSVTGQPLIVERVAEDSGMVSRTDSIGSTFNKLRKSLKIDPPFKALRKTGADFIEARQPELTSLYLSHATAGTKSFYVRKHYEKLFTLTDQMADHFDFGY